MLGAKFKEPPKLTTVKRGVSYERDECVVIKSPEDFNHFMFLLEFHAEQARQRGDCLVAEIWTPHVKGCSDSDSILAMETRNA